MLVYFQTKFSRKRSCCSDRILKSYILIILALTVTLTLKAANQFFRKTFWLRMMHHLAKFGSERFSDLENIFWIDH